MQDRIDSFLPPNLISDMRVRWDVGQMWLKFVTQCHVKSLSFILWYNYLTTEADEFTETSLKIILSLKTKPAKLIPYAIVKAIPATTKTAPAIKLYISSLYHLQISLSWKLSLINCIGYSLFMRDKCINWTAIWYLKLNNAYQYRYK